MAIFPFCPASPAHLPGQRHGVGGSRKTVGALHVNHPLAGLAGAMGRRVVSPLGDDDGWAI
jgi:hypothetical protein